MCKSSVRFVLFTFVMIITAAKVTAIARAGDDPIGKLGEAPIAEPADIRLAQIISALEKEEAKYRNIEYQFRIITRKYLRDFTIELRPEMFARGVLREPIAGGEETSNELRRVVLQDDLFRFEEKIVKHYRGLERRLEEISAFDGDKTRTVRSGLYANIHIGRLEHPDLYPPHCLPFVHYKLNFPLSVYLRGTKAIQDHPKTVRYREQKGSQREFIEVKTKIEGEERVDGLLCWKIRCDRLKSSDGPEIIQYLWLAQTRNYMCVKEVLYDRSADFGDHLVHDSRVERMREVAPGVWFPIRIVVQRYDDQAVIQKKIKRVDEIDTTEIESVNMFPNHKRVFFRDVDLPADLPTFVIREGTLEGSPIPEPVAGIDEAGELAKIVAAVKTEEHKYKNLDVKFKETYKYCALENEWGEAMYSVVLLQTEDMRSIKMNNMLYLYNHRYLFNNDTDINHSYSLMAFDGSWTRSYEYDEKAGKLRYNMAYVRKAKPGISRHDNINVFRPHAALIRNECRSSFSNFLDSSPQSDDKNLRKAVRYCGEAVLDGRKCVRLRDDTIDLEPDGLYKSTVYWLAVDRNYIPIRSVSHFVDPKRKSLPTEIRFCNDLREIAPGLWFPFRTVNLIFEEPDEKHDRLVIEAKREHIVESVKNLPVVDESIFHDVRVPANTTVVVVDEDGKHLDEFRQTTDGVPEITPKMFRYFQQRSKIRTHKQEQLEIAIKATFHKPAADFPKNAQWLGGDPLDWKTLRGKVVILVFWAEWRRPCRSELATTEHIHRDRAKNGLTVVGIHPPGSDLEDIKKVIDEFHLDYPICIDVPPQEGIESWGEIFGKFAVFEIPRAVLVNADGVVIAAGEFNEVVSKASDLVKKQ